MEISPGSATIKDQTPPLGGALFVLVSIFYREQILIMGLMSPKTHNCSPRMGVLLLQCIITEGI